MPERAMILKRSLSKLFRIDCLYSIQFIVVFSMFPKHKIHLQMEMFDTLDLLVELAQRHRINVKLNTLQQIFFYKSKYKHLFRYDAPIPNADDLNKEFRFKNQPDVCVVPHEIDDIDAYKWYVYFVFDLEM